MPPKGTFEKLSKDAENKPAILERSLQRLEWERTEQRYANASSPEGLKYKNASSLRKVILYVMKK
jgi:hypothetical protein